MGGQRLPDFGETGAPTTVVDPAVGTPSPTGQSSDPQQVASADNAGAPAAPAGSPTGEGPQPTPASPPAEPPATPAPQQPAEGQQPPPEVSPEGQQLPGTEAQPPSAEGEGEEELTEEEYQKFRTQLQEELGAEYDEKLRTQQSGQDRAMATVQQQLDVSNERLDQMNQEMREGKLQGLTPEEQAGLRKTWELDDREKKLNEYETSVKSFHSDTDILALLNEYKEFGVTEEILTAVPIDERELFCEQKRSEYWETKARAGEQPGTNGQPQQATPSPSPQAPVPAGASAPSDTGGGGAAEPPPQPNTEQGPDAMAENIGKSGSWQPAPFDVARRG